MAYETDLPWRRRPKVVTPNGLPRESWLAQANEAPLLPELEIVDAHHHLWDRQGFRYLLEEFAEDIGQSGHNVVSSVYVQCRTMYYADGPMHFRPLGEVEFIRGIAAQARSGFYGKTRVAQGIVGCADLLQGSEVAPVLEAMEEVGGGYFKGVRLPVASHPDPAVRSNPVPAPAGLLIEPRFIAGARELARRGLSLDVWVYQTQLADVESLARQLPELQIVLNHAGGPLGVGPFEGRFPEGREIWQTNMERLAQHANVAVKLGGFGMPIMGFGFERGEQAPTSMQVADLIAPYVLHCIALFGTRRCMFESNFPVDKGGLGYDVLWNAFKRIAWPLSDAQRADLFSDTARRIYRIPR
ncbi:amidohydrolase family protein [Halomonas dongshanensis]|uniref:Amidohydrolase family protein n=1 Tax=Halomonas dongshanensis TaxID=2890835 RepID=A0ABT2EEK2_9GAMM|nr:amidohydrolase family protein [Halomonas dongshanensis]MCS2609783.1 amidohydrolase family protein [Halomonas dongshanensis]